MADLLPKLAEVEQIPGLTSPRLSAWQFWKGLRVWNGGNEVNGVMRKKVGLLAMESQ